jgi:hypothetical protein
MNPAAFGSFPATDACSLEFRGHEFRRHIINSTASTGAMALGASALASPRLSGHDLPLLAPPIPWPVRSRASASREKQAFVTR